MRLAPKRSHEQTTFRERSDLGIYGGFVQGDGISQGMGDVIVTDGLTGNIVLKVAEGTAKQLPFICASLSPVPLPSSLESALHAVD